MMSVSMLAALVGGIPTTAAALSFLDVIVEQEVGDPGAANEAMIVIDWDTGVTPSHAWLYRWDGSATFGNAYDAIETAEGGAFDWSETGGFVSFMNYEDDDGDDHVTTAQGWLSFWSSADGESWGTTSAGVLDQLLVDGGWAGANANLPNGTWPGAAPAVPIPEPSAAALVGLGLAGLAWRGRSESQRFASIRG